MEIVICKECNEPNGHKCGCSVAIERAAHWMRAYSQVQFHAWDICEAEGIHLDDIAAGQKLANARIEEDWANSIGMPNTRRPRPMKAVEQPVCQYPTCDNHPAYCCDQCNTYFCSDHGTEGGDRQTQDVGAVAYPSVCWKCGGFNADFTSEAERTEYISALVNGLEGLAK